MHLFSRDKWVVPVGPLLPTAPLFINAQINPVTMCRGPLTQKQKCFQLRFELSAAVVSKMVDCSTPADRQRRSTCRQMCSVYVERHNVP